MKHLIRVLKSTICVVALPLFFTQSVSADLATELRNEIAMFEKDFQAEPGPGLVATADLFTGTGIGDAGLYQVVKTRTESLAAYHLSNPKDKVAAKSLTALLRAYGAFGKVESAEFFIDLVESSKSRGVRNRAHRVHPKLGWFKYRNELMQQGLESYEQGQDLMTYRFLSLVNSTDSSLRRWVSQEIQRRGGTGDSVYAAMREKVINEGKQDHSDLQLDALAWFCKTLARFDLENSRDLLLEIQSDPSYDRKLKKHARF